MTGIAPSSFERLLEHLDPNRDAASEKYLVLHDKLTTFAVWKGCPESESENIADQVFDRLTKKIDDGVEIENINAYAKQILRYVLLEHGRKRKEYQFEDSTPEQVTMPEPDYEPDEHVRCLRKCMAEVVPDQPDRKLILDYYDADAGVKNKEKRKSLAEEMGLTMNNLKVKAYRIRRGIEKCVNECVRKLAVTNSSKSITSNQGGKRDD